MLNAGEILYVLKYFTISLSLQLPELPSVLGGRRFSSTPSPDIAEPLDLLIKGEAQKSHTQIASDTIEQPPERAVEEVYISLRQYYYTCF